MSFKSVGAAIAISVCITPVARVATQDHAHQHPSTEKLGSVRFANSCSPRAQLPFTRAVALLHSFEFAPAIAAFGDTLKADPACAMANWGIALSRWGNPFVAGIRPPAQLQLGRDAATGVSNPGAKTERERAYLEAVARLFENFETIDQRARLLSYRDAMGALASRYPEDTEASIFYALALSASEDPADKTYASRLKAGAILERLFATQPEHPGLAHYIIHSYDVPALAGDALDAARRYSKIAPSAPHALHMPSHTFTRLGFWQDSIDTNVSSAAVARRVGSTAEELHAMDYQTYAYLQTGQDAAAQRLLGSLGAVAARFDPDAVGSAAPGSAGVFALAAIPARVALERRAWAEAAKLEPRASRFPYAEAMTYFARALGASHLGEMANARSAAEALGEIRDRLTQVKETYWAEQVEIQRQGAAAWVAWADGRTSEALAAMRAAADREDLSEKNAVTPGPIAPARELLGDMLLEMKQPAQALKEYEATLKKEPNRFRALYGAAQAARLSGDVALAKKYNAQLVKVCERGDKPGRAELMRARRE
jgi:tetratricopeptide (TPR) repeat protein